MKILPNTEAYEREILIDPCGFREYDARWRFPEEINLRGAQALGMGIGTMMRRKGVRPDIVVGHDYRSYSATIKQSLIIGLMAAGCRVHDIGLALSPVAYFAQHELDCPAVAMVTASHNENGWTGVKLGIEKSLTFGAELMAELKSAILEKEYQSAEGGSYIYVDDMKSGYLADIAKSYTINRDLKVVVACGNGTAGAYAPRLLEMIGCTVLPLDCNLDYTFPRHNPDPEDPAMLEEVKTKVRETSADIGFAFDGDGNRCGVVDNTGQEINPDKMGLILARYLAHVHKRQTIVVDIKSTGLFKTDPVLKEKEMTVDYWITGHSYIKWRMKELGALCGFEKSGHYFFNPPLGRGYDDGLLSAAMICHMLDQYPAQTLSNLKDELPRTWSSPTISTYCPDAEKYDLVDRMGAFYRQKMANGDRILGKKIKEIISVNGVRVVLEDGTWGLIRASSNKPSLVIVIESPVSEFEMGAMFKELDGTLSRFYKPGNYDQAMRLAA